MCMVMCQWPCMLWHTSRCYYYRVSFRGGVGGAFALPWLGFASPWKFFDSESNQVFLNLIHIASHKMLTIVKSKYVCMHISSSCVSDLSIIDQVRSRYTIIGCLRYTAILLVFLFHISIIVSESNICGNSIEIFIK